MTITELGAIGEFISSIAVLVTLIYLARQISQNTISNKMNARAASTSLRSEFVSELLHDPALRDIYDRGSTSYVKLPDEDKRVFDLFMNKATTHFSVMYYQSQVSKIDTDSEQENQRLIAGFARRPGYQEWWFEKGIWYFGDEFGSYISSEIEKSRRESEQVEN